MPTSKASAGQVYVVRPGTGEALHLLYVEAGPLPLHLVLLDTSDPARMAEGLEDLAQTLRIATNTKGKL